MKYLKLFEDISAFDEDDWDFEEEPEDIFKEEYSKLKRLYGIIKKNNHSRTEIDKLFLHYSYDMVKKEFVSQETVEKYIAWNNITPSEVMKFYKDKPNNIIKNTILGPMVFNLPKPNRKKK